ncbi:M12 family metallopeptidase [Dyadobacter sp. CY107]|uniref:M12 family metallopeptidase n=1 Tax=Dyadobacter fanqingshengii TaxID=2906443 RepID=UPI001F23E8B5|nr:M12 family metallopeptidase [Dyadobacter fanqingshengii]MCF2502077.1 M12 family metallopeptidase [Dyadobacter fanqingshengii]
MKINYLPEWATGLLLAASLLSSCKEDLEQAAPSSPATSIHSDSASVVKHGTFRGIPITYQEKDGKAILEGDILLSKEDLAPVKSGDGNSTARIEGAGITDNNYKWPNWTVPYFIEPDWVTPGPALNEAVIKEAIAQWELNTPIRFVPKTNQKDYVIFARSNYDASAIGKQGGAQLIHLSDDNNVSTIIHEIGHAVGLYHEQSRRDRDNYIDIHWDNIIDEEKYNFNRWPIGQGFDYGAFDYESIMMYYSHGFSKNGQPTISRKDGQSYTPGSGLSTGDVNTVISMYSNLYFVMGDKLKVVNENQGRTATLSDGWTGTSKTLAQDNEYVWGIQGGKLWKANRFNGAYEQVGADDWTGAKGLTGLDAQGNFYAVYQNRLYKVSKYGQRTMLGSREWPVVKTLYYHNNALYVAWGVLLNKVNITTGEIEATYGKLQWSGTQAIAAVTGDAKYLYVMRNNALFRVNLDTGAVEGGEYFADVKAMTARSGYLYIVSGKKLIKMDEYSNKQQLVGSYENTTSVSAY